MLTIITDDMLYNILIRSDFKTIINLGETYGCQKILSKMKSNAYWFDRFKYYYNFEDEYDENINWKLSYFDIAKESLCKIDERCIYNCMTSNNISFIKLLVNKSIIQTNASLESIMFYSIITDEFELFSLILIKLGINTLSSRYQLDLIIQFTHGKHKSLLGLKNHNIIETIFLYDRIKMFHLMIKTFGIEPIKIHNIIGRLFANLCIGNSVNLLNFFLADENTRLSLIKNGINEFVHLSILHNSIEVLDILRSLSYVNPIKNDIFRICISHGNYESVKYVVENLTLEVAFSSTDYNALITDKFDQSNYFDKIVQIFRYFNNKFEIPVEWQTNLAEICKNCDNIEMFEKCIDYIPIENNYNDNIVQLLIQYISEHNIYLNNDKVNIIFKILDSRCSDPKIKFTIKEVCSNILQLEDNEENIEIELFKFYNMHLNYQEHHFVKCLAVCVGLFTIGAGIWCAIKLT